MAAIKGSERGLRSPLSVRVGIDLPQFKGQNQHDDPGAIGDDQFILLENVRLDGGAIIPRPGLEPVLDDPMSGCVMGIFDDRNPSEPLLFWSTP